MNEMDDWQAAQHADELNRLHAVVQALQEAERHGTPHEVVLTLARECGAGEIYKPTP